ncbi:hypothetical protein TorRG33x02_335090, partial [Trema orientale]
DLLKCHQRVGQLAPLVIAKTNVSRQLESLAW